MRSRFKIPTSTNTQFPVWLITRYTQKLIFYIFYENSTAFENREKAWAQAYRRNVDCCENNTIITILANTTNGRAYATVLCMSSVTLCIVAKRCVLEQMVLLTAYRKSYMRNRLVAYQNK